MPFIANGAAIFDETGAGIVEHVEGATRQESEQTARLFAAAPELLEVAEIEHELHMRGYTKATAKRLGPEALDAYCAAGSPGLNNWRRRKREAALSKAKGE